MANLQRKKTKKKLQERKPKERKKMAEKEKAKEEKATQKAQKEKERAALMERDRLLSEMANLASNLRSSGTCEVSEPPPSDGEDSVILEQGLDECFNDNDIVSECSKEYLNHTPSNTMALTPESRTSHLDHSGAKVVNSAPSLLLPNQASNYNSRQPFQPRQLMNQNSDCYSQTPRPLAGKGHEVGPMQAANHRPQDQLLVEKGLGPHFIFSQKRTIPVQNVWNISNSFKVKMLKFLSSKPKVI